MVKEINLINGFKKYFNKEPEFYIDTGGRYEILGNHTDHNHGLCLVGNSSLRIKACLAKNKDMVIIKSRGFRTFKFNVNNLKKKKYDSGTSAGLCKGVLKGLSDLGYKVGGFEAYIESEIPSGSGVSSSAAIESLFGFIISYLYNDGKVKNIDIAKIGQYSENYYFNKPCGLLDQIGTSFDSSNFIDFEDVKNPKIRSIKFNLPVKIFLIKSIGDHANLTPLYANIPNSMKFAAKKVFDCEFLRDIKVNDPVTAIKESKLSSDIKRKAVHFFDECQTVLDGEQAILNNDVDAFFDAVRKSQNSSCKNLENTFVKGEYEGSPQEIIDDVNKTFGDKCAIRIHGGGFKGTTICFVKPEFADEFRQYLKSKYVKNRYFEVSMSDKCVNFKKY